MGVSRDTSLSRVSRDERLGSMINQDRRVPNFKNRVDEATEQTVVSYAIEYPAHG